MATSIQTAGEKVQFLKDLDLIAFISLLDQDLKFDPRKYPALEPVIAKWRQDIEVYGPGTIDLHLDEMMSDTIAKSEMLLFLAEAEGRLTDYENTIPASVLNEHCKVPGVRFSDYSTLTIVTLIRKLRDLIG